MWTVNVGHSIAPKIGFVGGEGGAARERDPQLASAERCSGNSAQRESLNVRRLVARLHVSVRSSTEQRLTRQYFRSQPTISRQMSSVVPSIDTPFHRFDLGSISHMSLFFI
jgi:hypothetical protein